MKLEINTQTKTIIIKDSVRMKELIAFMKDLKLDDYSIVSDTTWTYFVAKATFSF